MKKFFKKLGNSIVKFERYPAMASEGVPAALKYLVTILLLISMLHSFLYVKSQVELMQQLGNYMEEKLPEFTYEDNQLKVEGEQPVIIDNDDTSLIKKVIIDANQDSEEEINKYKDQIKEAGRGILILKDKFFIIERTSGEVSYDFQTLLSQVQEKQITKSDIIKLLTNINVTVPIWLGLFLNWLIIYLLVAIAIAIIMATIGYFVAAILGVKMKYKIVFNMSIYALTLSIILNTIYVAINIFREFSIEFFDVMYIAVAFIYLIAAIFLTRIDLMKTQEQITPKEEEKEEKENKTEEEEKREMPENKENKKNKKEEKKKNKEDDNKEESGGEPEGSNV